MKENGMKVLNLIIKQVYFDAILSGEKTEEYREIRPNTFRKYCRYLIDGKEYERLEDYVPEDPTAEFEWRAVPIEYDALRLYVGYHTDRDSMLVEVKGRHIDYFEDEDGELMSYELDGVTYLVAEMVYELGEILEKNVKPKKKK